jgi:hypothetical protein
LLVVKRMKKRKKALMTKQKILKQLKLKLVILKINGKLVKLKKLKLEMLNQKLNLKNFEKVVLKFVNASMNALNLLKVNRYQNPMIVMNLIHQAQQKLENLFLKVLHINQAQLKKQQTIYKISNLLDSTRSKINLKKVKKNLVVVKNKSLISIFNLIALKKQSKRALLTKKK